MQHTINLQLASIHSRESITTNGSYSHTYIMAKTDIVSTHNRKSFIRMHNSKRLFLPHIAAKRRFSHQLYHITPYTWCQIKFRGSGNSHESHKIWNPPKLTHYTIIHYIYFFIWYVFVLSITTSIALLDVEFLIHIFCKN